MSSYYTEADEQQQKIETTRALVADRWIKPLPPLPAEASDDVATAFADYETAVDQYHAADLELAEAEAERQAAALNEAAEIKRLVNAGEDPMAVADFIVEADRKVRSRVAVLIVRANEIKAAVDTLLRTARAHATEHAALAQPAVDTAGTNLRGLLNQVAEARHQLTTAVETKVWWEVVTQGPGFPAYGVSTDEAKRNARAQWTVTDDAAARTGALESV